MKRTVFYISGFDPRGPAHYHRLYAAECAKQSLVNGVAMTVSTRRTVDNLESAWTVTAADGSQTDYRFLRYEDIIRRQWPRSAAAIVGAILRYSWHFLRMGVFAMIARNSWPCFIAVTYPVLLLLGGVAASLVLGLTVALGLRPWAGTAAFWIVPFAPLLLVPLKGRVEKSLNAFWFARSCAFLVDRTRGSVPGIEDRCLAFAERIAAEIRSGGRDEVLVVSHSVGTQLAVTVAARVLEAIDKDSRFSFLTLGQAIAMTPPEAAARQFRKDLLAIAVSDQIDWIDVTSAIDGSCIALSDPLALSRVARPPGVRVQPKLLSARFNRAFRAETYAAIRGNFLRAHFQYLMATELPVDYDYFLITGGNQRLAERFAHLESVTGFDRFRMGKT